MVDKGTEWNMVVDAVNIIQMSSVFNQVSNILKIIQSYIITFNEIECDQSNLQLEFLQISRLVAASIYYYSCMLNLG